MRKFIFILKRKDTEKTSTLLNERNESEEKTLRQHLGLILHEHVRNIKEPRIRKKMNFLINIPEIFMKTKSYVLISISIFLVFSTVCRY
jgi:hypothetical protein